MKINKDMPSARITRKSRKKSIRKSIRRSARRSRRRKSPYKSRRKKSTRKRKSTYKSRRRKSARRSRRRNSVFRMSDSKDEIQNEDKSEGKNKDDNHYEISIRHYSGFYTTIPINGIEIELDILTSPFKGSIRIPAYYIQSDKTILFEFNIDLYNDGKVNLMINKIPNFYDIVHAGFCVVLKYMINECIDRKYNIEKIICEFDTFDFAHTNYKITEYRYIKLVKWFQSIGIEPNKETTNTIEYEKYISPSDYKDLLTLCQKRAYFEIPEDSII